MLDRWAEYSEEILNSKNYIKDYNNSVHEPDVQKIEKVIMKLKNNKSPGENRFSAKLLKK